MTNLLLAFFGIAALISQGVCQCTENDIRLVGGSGDWEGNVQVCYKGEWGHVCDNSWTQSDAQVACKQLGYSATTGVEYRRYSYYGYSTGKHFLDYVQCTGSESKLTDCSSSVALGSANCGKGEMAGVFCGYGGPACTQGSIRLANNYISSYGRSEGRVEVCDGGTWGLICGYPSYTWTSPDARVACRQLGFTSTTVQSYYYGGGIYGYGFLPTKFSYMGCSGSENSLFSCTKSSTSYCISNYYNAGARCYSTASGCTNGDVRLFSAFDSTPDNEGILQICNSGTWYSVCQYYYSCYVAKTACVQLGYTGAVALRYNGGFYYGYTQYNDYYRYYCYSSQYTSLSQCYKYYYYSCGAYNDAMGLICYEGSTASECTSGDVRLVDGKTDNEGRVEYCYSGAWSPVCSLSSRAATLMCQKLGYTQFTWGLVINDERFGRKDTETVFNYLYCSSTAAKLSDCTEYTKGGGCYVSSSTCYKEYALRCFNPGTCKDGDVRLQDGLIEQEGRPEVCINGVWSTFCQWSWSSIDAFVFCNMLGYDGPNPTIYYNSYFGSGYGPVAYSYMYCQGWEKDIHDCTKTVYPGFTCYSTYIAGTVCKEGCVNGDVRLVGGGFDNEGTVEICFNNLWGLIADHGWNDADARVVCRQLGHELNGIFKPVLKSQYGKPNKTIHLKDVACVGDEDDLTQCTKTTLGLTGGKNLLNVTEVAGVDCIYDEPTPPPCIVNPSIDPSDMCTTPGDIRLINSDGVENKDEGRAEYCNGQYWTPFCSMDGLTASVVCRYLEHTQYYWGAVIETGEYGTLLNYSLVQNVTCTGSENSLSECVENPPQENCLPWCPNSNIGVKCFDSGKCIEGDVRLVDAIIENEGRVEVCVNGVWGSICDDGWDKTDAHVVCSQLGHPELEPVVFSGSYFGDGSFPIVYSNMDCGGWEDTVKDCSKTTYSDFYCPRSNVAGLLCGYDCEDGDVRLVGSQFRYEGYVEICFDNLWGLVEDQGWTALDAQVVCRQLGYEVEGTVASFTQQASTAIPDKTVHSSDVDCVGNEESLNDCTQTSFSLNEGRNKRQMSGLKVAGVTCYTPDRCVPPPTDTGTDCVDGDLRITGDEADNGAGTLEYCYKGAWSGFCGLGEKEAVVACRQLGYTDFSTVSIFTDGRMETTVSNTSLFTNFSCGTDAAQLKLSDCDIIDSCQSSCSNPIGIACSSMANCMEGDVRLGDGSIKQEGRVEVCHDNIWGSVCGQGFDYTDAYVVCKELDFGVSEPMVYTNSYFGDGNVPVVYSELECNGYENTVLDCGRKEFGSFSCARDNIAGVVCQDNCMEGDLRLVNGTKDSEGTLQVCYYSMWGLVANTEWDDVNTNVACRELGYDLGEGYLDSPYGKPDVSVHLSSVNCNGTEERLIDCDSAVIPPDEGKDLTARVDVVGLKCTTRAAQQAEQNQQNEQQGLYAGIGIMVVMFVMSLVIIASLVIYVVILRKARQSTLDQLHSGKVTMSSLHDTRSIGVTNPAAVGFSNPEEGEGDDQSFMEKVLYDDVPAHQ